MALGLLPRAKKTIRVTLTPQTRWEKLPPDGRDELIPGFCVQKLVNAIHVKVGEKKFHLNDRLTNDEAEELNKQEDVEVTIVPAK